MVSLNYCGTLQELLAALQAHVVKVDMMLRLGLLDAKLDQQVRLDYARQQFLVDPIGAVERLVVLSFTCIRSISA